ncbi:hypothetical protein NDU88_006693 [Pleurodeles waltl]|uniref:Uncharacterized protein n=1 Tax=Pleurodeles waltl TaxID=8319 RepID=A0AAV7LRE6_PLEWA|nr:hypothetical protein NDU88_006693 [Pleurodeles waltl]
MSHRAPCLHAPPHISGPSTLTAPKGALHGPHRAAPGAAGPSQGPGGRGHMSAFFCCGPSPCPVPPQLNSRRRAPLSRRSAPRYRWARSLATTPQAPPLVRGPRPLCPRLRAQPRPCRPPSPAAAQPVTPRGPRVFSVPPVLGDAPTDRARKRCAAEEARAAELTDTRLLMPPSWPRPPFLVVFAM